MSKEYKLLLPSLNLKKVQKLLDSSTSVESNQRKSRTCLHFYLLQGWLLEQNPFKSQGLCRRQCLWVTLTQEDNKPNMPVEFLADRKWSPRTVSLAPEAIILLRANAIQQTDSILLLNPPTSGVVLCHHTTHSSHQRRHSSITTFLKWDRLKFPPSRNSWTQIFINT